MASCSTCRRPAAPDAGPAAAPARVRHSTDLRSALMLMFPEYRFGAPRRFDVSLTRTVSGGSDWRAVLASTLARGAFTPDGEGGAGGTRPPFRLELVREAGPQADFRVAFTVEPGKLPDLYQVPVPLSTLDLGLLLPRGESLTTEREEFAVHLAYIGYTEERAAFLVAQLVRLCLSNQQWVLKGGALPAYVAPPPRPRGEVPRGPVGEKVLALPPDAGSASWTPTDDATLEGLVDGAVLRVRREGQRVTVDYTLVTDAPAGTR